MKWEISFFKPLATFYAGIGLYYIIHQKYREGKILIESRDIFH
jgi:hypothetical protein